MNCLKNIVITWLIYITLLMGLSEQMSSEHFRQSKENTDIIETNNDAIHGEREGKCKFESVLEFC